MLTLKQVAQIDGRPHRVELSADGRWVALRYGSEWRMFDALTRQESGIIHLPDSHWATVSPNGTALANMRDGVIRVAHLDGRQVVKMYTYPGVQHYGDDVCFTADSQQLWATLCNDDGSGKLALLDAVTLEEITFVPMPKVRPDDFDYWSEPHSILHIPSDTLALHHAGGDHLIGVFFFKHHDRQIAQQKLFISPSASFRTMHYISFSASGQLMAGIDGPFVWVWRLVDMQLLGRGLENLLDIDNENDEFGVLTFLGEQLIIEIGGESRDELCIVDIPNEAVLTRCPMPPDFHAGADCINPLRGQTLVGMKGDDVVIYRIGL
ncbi:MAG: hypothetical protein IPO91_17315 [Chloroflexi bacterium]|nr:hypothetical protein [Chloroflexota bacterium]